MIFSESFESPFFPLGDMGIVVRCRESNQQKMSRLVIAT